MFTHLKLATFTWVLAILMALTTAVITVSAFLVEKNIVVIDDTWQLYQTDLSEKARLEGALRAAIGYGGMIHDFKNYILRSDDAYKEQVESHIGAAEAILAQYNALELTTAETIAINDIFTVFTAYRKAVHKIQVMRAQGRSIFAIDHAVKIDDTPAIRGLKILRYEVILKKKNDQPLNKSRLVADLRAALGYGGMIHKFKNYILRHKEVLDDEVKEAILLNEISAKVQLARDSISQYQQFPLGKAEKLALNDIERALAHYSAKSKAVHQLMKQHQSVKEIDRVVKVNDAQALRGLQILEREINRNVAARSANVSKALRLVNQALQFGKWSSIVAIFLVTLIAIVLIRFSIIKPVLELTKNMMQLADNKLETEISGYQRQNEIGSMSRAVMVFKSNMIRQKDSELALVRTNDELQQRLEENKQLRERAEEQTTKALLMAENMAAASKTSEKAMAKAEEEELFVSSILNAVRDGIILINSKGIIEAFNPGAEDIFGYKAFEVKGKNISMLMPEPHSSAHDSYLEKFLDGKTTRDQSKPMEQIALRKNDDTFSAEITLNTIHIADEIKITGVVRDITERKKWEEQIKQLAMTDPLTGLANRNEYNKRLKETLQHAERFKTQFALIVIDLDQFKPVNDTYGHQVGDILLQNVADTLVACCREVDVVARLGGDEFAIIANGLNEPEEVAILADRIVDKLSQSFSIKNNNIQIGASLGISGYPDDSEDIDVLQRMADEALYVSKQEGRNTYRYYSNISK